MNAPFNAEIARVVIMRGGERSRITYYPERDYNKNRVKQIAEEANKLRYTIITNSASTRTAHLKARWCVRRHNPWKWTGMRVTSVIEIESGGLTNRYKVEVTVNR